MRSRSNPQMPCPATSCLALVGTAITTYAALSGCSGPIPLQQAVWSRHAREYAEAMASTPDSPKVAWFANRARHTGQTIDSIRRADAALSTTRNPFNANSDPEAVSRGAVIYRENCARCHGTDVRGHGPDMLASHPTSDFHGFTKRIAVTLHGGAPRAWFTKINEGYGDVLQYPEGPSRAMPAFGDRLAREQIWMAITYLQSLDAHAKPDPEAGETRDSASPPNERRAAPTE